MWNRPSGPDFASALELSKQTKPGASEGPLSSMEHRGHMQSEHDVYIAEEGVVYYDDEHLNQGMHHAHGNEMALVPMDAGGNDEDDMSLSQPSASEGLPPFEG